MIYTAEVCWSMANNKLNYFNCTLPRRQDSEVWVCDCVSVCVRGSLMRARWHWKSASYVRLNIRATICNGQCINANRAATDATDSCHFPPFPAYHRHRKVDFNISFTFATATANQLIHYNCLLEKLLTKASSLSFSSSSRTVALQKRSKTANQVIFLAFRVNYFRWEAKAFIYYTAREGTLLFAIGSLSASCHK